jgi:hypothetical protein
LGQALRDEPLEQFVMHSSIVSVTGNLGQASYGAANNFLDAFARYRRHSHRQPAVAINWASLSGIGVLAGQAKLEQHLQDTRGFEALPTPMILAGLDAALCIGRPQIAVATFDWATVQDTVLASNPLVAGRFSSLIEEYGRVSGDSPIPVTRTDDLTPEEVRKIVINDLTDVLAPGTTDDLGNETRSLPIMGLDSNGSIAARENLNRHLGIRIPLDELLNQEISATELVNSVVEAASRGLRIEHA